MVEDICFDPDCDRPVRPHGARGWCIYHYKLQRQSGLPRVVELSLEDRFWPRVNKHGSVPVHRPELGPCWLWRGGCNAQGYGKFLRMMAHRFAWELLVSSIPEGLRALHHCDNPPCVKAIADEHGPTHLFIGTQADNIHDMLAKGRHSPGKRWTHCKRGHPLTPENTWVKPSSPRGKRECIICKRERERLARQRYR